MIGERAETMSNRMATASVSHQATLLQQTYRRGAILDAASDWEIIELRRRAHAGVWAARTALVLSVPFAVTAWAFGEEHAWLAYMLLPVVAAFFAGVFFGAAICDRRQITDDSLAGRRGTFVALATYIIYALEMGALSYTPFNTALDTFMASLIVSGWLVFPVAFLAGMLAFRAREGAYRYQSEPAA
jgi:hypothetical protein